MDTNENYLIKVSKLSGKVRVLIGYAYYPSQDMGTWRQQYSIETIGM